MKETFIKIFDEKYEIHGIEEDSIPIEFNLDNEDKIFCSKCKNK